LSRAVCRASASNSQNLKPVAPIPAGFLAFALNAAFPTEEAAIKLLYLGLQNAANKWTMPIQNWSLAMNQMAILFEGRMLIPGLTENSITQNI